MPWLADKSRLVKSLKDVRQDKRRADSSARPSGLISLLRYFSTAPGNTPGRGFACCWRNSGCGSGLRGIIWSRIAAL